MRRNDDLIRKLMLDLEVANSRVFHSHQVDGYTQDQVAYHLALMIKAGLAEGAEPRYRNDGSDSTIPAAVFVSRLTPAGHDFISEIRDDTVWAKVKERTVKVGGSVSLEVLKQIAGAVVKQLVGLT